MNLFESKTVRTSLIRKVALAVFLPCVLPAEVNTLKIPEGVVKANAAWSLDILASNEYWSAGHIPQAGDSIVITRDGGTLPYVKLSRDLSVSNITVSSPDYYITGPGRFVFETAPCGSVAQTDSVKLNFMCELAASVPVTWAAYGGVRLLCSATFAAALEITGLLELYSSGKTLVVNDLKGNFSYTGGSAELTSGILSIPRGTVVVTNAGEFGGSIHMQQSTLGHVGGTDAIAAAGVAPELVTDGLVTQFDASDLSSFTFTNGNRVAAWRDTRGGLVAEPLEKGVAPWYLAHALGTNGIVDFGPSETCLLYYPQSASAPLRFSAPIANAKTVFYMMDTQMGGGFLLPTTTYERNFVRASTFANGFAGAVRAGVWAKETANPNVVFRSNGSPYDMSAREPLGAYEILTLANPTVFAHPIAGMAYEYEFEENGKVRTDWGTRGHQRIAEFLAYDRTLDETEIKKVESYLYHKWLCGRHALRHVGYMNHATLDIAAPLYDGYETHVQHIQGRGGITKTGAGTLVFDHPREIGDAISVTAGTVAFPDTEETTRTAASAATYATNGLLLHLDATAAATLTTNALGEVTAWRSRDDIDNGLVPGVEVKTNPYTYGNPPFLRSNLHNGKTMVDFGTVGSMCFMDLSTRITTVRTVLMALDGRQGGNHILCDTGTGGGRYFERGTCGSSVYDGYDIGQPILCMGSVQRFGAWSNGELITPQRRGFRGVPEVLTLIDYYGDATIGRIGLPGANTYTGGGGLAVGELLAWNRVLTAEELAQAYKYLQNRWLDVKGPTVYALDASGDGAVSARPAISVGTLSGSGKLAAKDGTVTVHGTAGFTGTVSAEDGGAWEFRSDNGPVPTSNPVTDGLLAHFDPTAADTVTTDANGAVTAMTSVNDATLTAAPLNAGYGPLLTRADKVLYNYEVHTACGSNAVLDCGTYAENTSTVRGLQFSRVFTNVHTVVAILGGFPKRNVPGLFGSSTANGLFLHGQDEKNNYCLSAGLLLNTSSYKFNGTNYANTKDTLGADAWLNGRRVIPRSDTGCDGYQILTFVWPRRMALNQLGYNTSDGTCGGGQLYGEFLMWDRCLTDAERKGVEAYLAAKWFGKTWHGYTRAGHPDAPAVAGGDGAVTLNVGAGAVTGLGAASGSGTFTKTGAGTLELRGSTTELSGDVVIRAGTVRYAAERGSDEEIPVTDGLIACFDAGRNVLTNEAGTVTNWQACAGTAPYDHYAATRSDARTSWPVVTNGLNGHAWIDFGPYATGCGLYFDAATHPESVVTSSSHAYGTLPDCQTSILMFNAERGGGFVLGNLDGGYYHRCFTPPPSDYTSAVFDNNIGLWAFYVDGRACAYNEQSALTNTWQVIEISKYAYNAVAGFAHDRALSYSSGNSNGRQGGQGLAEALFYNRKLTDEERIRVRTYLYHKYLGRNAPASGTVDMMFADAPKTRSLSVASGATFDLNGCTHTVGTLSCAGGTVTDGTLNVTDALAYVPGESLTVSGTVRFGDDVSVVLPDDWKLAAGTFRLLTATSFENVEALRRVRMTLGPEGRTKRARFEVNGNAIDLVVYKMGTVLLLR